MKRLSETGAANYDPNTWPETRWVTASSVLGARFLLVKANVGQIDGQDRAFLHVLFSPPGPITSGDTHLPAVDSLGVLLDTHTEYVISSSGQAIIGLVQALRPDDYPIRSLCIVAVPNKSGKRLHHEIRDADEWGNTPTAGPFDVEEIPSDALLFEEIDS